MCILDFEISYDFVVVVDEFSVYLAVFERQRGADVIWIAVPFADLGSYDHGITVRITVVFTVWLKVAYLVGVTCYEAGDTDSVKLGGPDTKLFLFNSER